MRKQIIVRLDEELLKQFKLKLERESKTMTLFLLNAIKQYVKGHSSR